jgi:small-conductance mechanosensitive channel
VEASTRRIEEMLQGGGRPAVTSSTHRDGTMVSLGGSPAFLVTRVDVVPDLGETTQNVAREAALRLDRAIEEHREQRSPRYMLEAALLVLLATLLFTAVVFALLRVNRVVGGRITAVAARHAQKVRVEGVSLLDEAHIAGATRRMLTLLAWATVLFAGYLWLTFVLERIPYTRAWGEQLEGGLFAIAERIALATVNAIPGLAVVVVIIVATRTVIGAARLFFARIEHRGESIGALDRDTAMPTRRLLEAALWLLALALAFPFLPGSHTDAFKGISVIAGLAASIAASSVLGQAASGLSLIYGRLMRKGEYVRVDEVEGRVAAIGIFTTRIRTDQGEEVIVPNARVFGGGVRNYSRAHSRPGFITIAKVTVGYATPWQEVKSMLLEAARRTPDLEREPAPFARQAALEDFYAAYELVGFTPNDRGVDRADVLDRLNSSIQDVFAEREVPLLAPHYMTDPPRPQIPARS